jgi:outer membrane immunogenic protein
MKKILAIAALVGTSVGAQAADLPAKAKYYKAPIVAQVYNWSGFYFGVNAGVGFGRSYTQLSHLGGDAASQVGGLGGVGGGQIGYNWQYGNLLGFGNVVLGLEADIQGAGLDDTRTCAFLCTPGTGFGVSQKLDWFGTARARAGIATGSVLSYVTGGFAYGGVKTSITDIAVPAASVATSETRTGWTLGSGVEAALGGNWTGKIEYLYVDLGKQTGGSLLDSYGYRTEIREQIFRVGLNYRIGGNAIYAPEPIANWSGLYLGGNFGGATALNRSSLTLPGVVAEKFNLSPDGFMGGGQIGYNWQAANWVYGLEADFQGSTLKDSDACQVGCNVGTSTLLTFNQKMEWFGTFRGRLGYSVGSTLFYGTGGLAYGDVKTNILGAAGAGNPINASFSHTKTGYAVGGGIESPFNLFGWFGPNWTSKTEYLYVDLGRTTDTVPTTGPAAGLQFSTKTQEQTIRTGLNYHFNSPVVAKY